MSTLPTPRPSVAFSPLPYPSRSFPPPSRDAPPPPTSAPRLNKPNLNTSIPIPFRHRHRPPLQRRRTDALTRITHFWAETPIQDELERKLQRDVQTGDLLRAYGTLKRQRSGRLWNCLVGFKGLGIEGQGRRREGREGDGWWHFFDVDEGLEFRDCLGLLREGLRGAEKTQEEGSVQICVLSNFIPQNIRYSGYSFVSNIFASSKTSQAPLLTLHVLQQEWQFGPEVIKTCESEPSLRKSYMIDLPSSQDTSSRLSLQSLEWTTINMCWFRDITAYSQDLLVYVWQPHLEHVTAIGASIFIGPSDSEPRHCMVYLKPSEMEGQSLAEIATWLQSTIPKPIKQLCGADIEILSTILSIFSLLIRNTKFMVQRLCEEIDSLHLEGRRNPSVSKLHYTAYLGDCQRCSSQAISNALELLSKIPGMSESRESLESSVTDWCETVEKDLQYLQKRLKIFETNLLELRASVKEQLDLRQIRLSRTLAILAAIYLPFSFVSSFFGMNVIDPLWPTKSQPSNSDPIIRQSVSRNSPTREDLGLLIRDTTSDNSSLSLSQNQTDAIVTAVYSAGPHLFTFTTFLIVSFTVTFATIVLPLLAGSILRITLRSLHAYKGHWRIFLFILGLGCLVILRVFLPDLGLSYVYIIIFASSQGLLAIYKLYSARRSGLEKRRWIIYTAILSTSMAYDIDAAYHIKSIKGSNDTLPSIFIGLTGILPTLYLFIIGFVGDIMAFARPRMAQWLNRIQLPCIVIKHRKAWVFALCLFYIGFNVGLFLVPGTGIIYVVGFGIGLGLYGIDRFWTACQRHEDRVKWGGFLLSFAAALTAERLIPCEVYLEIAIVPFVYLVAYRVCIDDQRFIMTYFPEWLNWGRGKEGLPVTVGEERS